MKGSPEFAATLAAAAPPPDGRCASGPEGPERWNPLAYGNATELKDKLIASERFTEPHYQRQAERFLQLALGVLARPPSAAAPTLREVVAAMEPGGSPCSPASSGTSGRRRSTTIWPRSAVMASAPPGAWRRGWRSSASPSPGRFSSRRTRRQPGRSTCAGRSTARRSCCSASTRAAMASSPHSSERWRSRTFRRHRPPPRRAPATGGRWRRRDRRVLSARHRQPLALVARGRGSRLGVLIATQELADLDRAGPGFRDQVVGNTTL